MLTYTVYQSWTQLQYCTDSKSVCDH